MVNENLLVERPALIRSARRTASTAVINATTPTESCQRGAFADWDETDNTRNQTVTVESGIPFPRAC